MTLRETKSRYLLDIRLLENQSDVAVRRAMTRVFAREGLPEIIRVDNGAPFGGKGALGLSRFQRVVAALGDPGGVHSSRTAKETMLRTSKCMAAIKPRWWPRPQRTGELNSGAVITGGTRLQPLPPSRGALARVCLHDITAPVPASGQPSCPHCALPDACPLRAVRPHGDIKWQGRLRFIGRAFVGHKVALQPRSANHWRIYLGPLMIGELHAKDTAGLRKSLLATTAGSTAQTVTHVLAS